MSPKLRRLSFKKIDFQHKELTFINPLDICELRSVFIATIHDTVSVSWNFSNIATQGSETNWVVSNMFGMLEALC